MMQSILAAEIAEGICSVYLDDVLIHSKDFSEHLAHIERVLKRLDDCASSGTLLTLVGLV